jgi:DNA-binding SARP family transcriptional activator
MIRVLALGHCAIELDGTRVSAESELVFGLLLYLAARAGTAVSRDEAQALLWPDLSHTRGRHCLRQAAYRLRQLGVPLRSDNSSLSVPLGEVTSDYAVLLAEGAPAAAFSDSKIGEVLPGYLPTFSAPYAAWVEEYRARLTQRIRHGLVRAIVDLRSKGRYREAEPLARVCLTSDPYNEVATLTLAEATAVLGGNRAEALAILDRYVDEVGSSPDRRLALSASVLRRRISERFVEQRYAAPPDPPFVGREDVLELMVEKMQESVAGRSKIVYLWGEPGIGKTRLLEELSKVAHVQGVRVERYTVSPNDPERPLALFSSILPRMMRMAGAVGISPEAYEAIQRFVDPSAWERVDPPRTAAEAALVFGRLKSGICELFEALADERAMALLVDDVHWCDERSLEVLSEVVEHVRGRRVAFVLTSRESCSAPASRRLEALCTRAAVRRLDGLSAGQVETLLAQIAEQRNFSLTSEFVRRTVDTSAGNPLFVSELATHYGWNGVRDDLPHNMQTLLQKRLYALSSEALLVFQTCAILGEHANVSRLERVLGTSLGLLASRLQELELAGLLVSRNETLSCRHHLLARESRRALTPSVAVALSASTANVLRTDLDERLDRQLADACLLHLAEAHQSAIGVRLAIELAKRFLALGLPNDARNLADAALKLHPVGDAKRESLGTRLIAERASGAWTAVNRTLVELQDVAGPSRSVDYNEINRIAFETRLFLAEPGARGLNHQLAALRSTQLSSSAHKTAALNALIACCDAFDRTTAREVYDAVFNTTQHRLATVDDLRGRLVFHTSFGSLDEAMAVADALISGFCSDAERSYRQTQVVRWCARPFHLAADEDRAQSILSQASELAQAKGEMGEACECAAASVEYALDLEDKNNASIRLEELSNLSDIHRSPYGDASLLLMRLRTAILDQNPDGISATMSAIERSKLPNCAAANLTLTACRLWTASLLRLTPADADVASIAMASDDAMASMEMDWKIAALCSLATQDARLANHAHRAVSRYLGARRPRYSLPELVLSFVS